jgi:predicted DCC family thiol-disulfide oxidoreductase YuxK
VVRCERTSHPAVCAGPPGHIPGKLTVHYDVACPLCRREIDFYRGRGGAGLVEWVDAAGSDAELLAPDLVRADALARFHVRLPDGTLESGSRGFAALWSVLPGFG